MAATSPEILVEGKDAARRDQIAALTGLRGFAALVVVVVHASSISAYPWVGFHNYGPIALFVLSGFLLFQPWSRWLLGHRDRPHIGDFARRRLWRIFPPYLAVLLIVALVYSPARPADAGSWVRNATLTHIYQYGDLRRGLYHTWSLATEISWYVALPMLGLVMGWFVHRLRLRPLVVVLVAAACAGVLAFGWRWARYFRVEDLNLLLTMSSWLPAYAVCFLGGSVLGHIAVVRSARQGPPTTAGVAPWWPWGLTLVGLAAGITAASRLGGPWTFADTTFIESLVRFWGMLTMALALLAAAAFAPRKSLVSRLFGNGPMVAIGRWSYGLYLWHLPVMLIIYDRNGMPAGSWGLALWIGIITVVSLPLSAATYRFIEKPAMAYSRTLSSTSR
ncbi:MAG: acyltransferase [Actinomycetia bacterium]|nr:acyltransferase [Actinomycetes bacterium]